MLPFLRSLQTEHYMHPRLLRVRIVSCVQSEEAAVPVTGAFLTVQYLYKLVGMNEITMHYFPYNSLIWHLRIPVGAG